MSRIIKFAKTIRRNWKKSTVGFSALSYGAYYGCDRYKTFQMMRAYCEEALTFGMQPTSPLEKQRHVTVILNPMAHKNKAKFLYEKFAAPLFHLAGLKVSLVVTENEGQAIDLMEIMENTDAVVIAGGNGTVHEAVTGLLRREEYENNVTYSMPIGILPVGHTNTVAKVIFGESSSNNAQWLAEAAMAVVKNETMLLDVIKVEIEEEKALFTLSGFEFGTFPDVETRISKYWYFGPFKDRVAFFFNSFKNKTLSSELDVDHMPPCEGCSKCYATPRRKKEEPKRWWSAFLPRMPLAIPLKDYSKVLNDECGVWNSQTMTSSNIMVSTSLKNFRSFEQSESAIHMKFYPKQFSISAFIKTGLQYHRGQLSHDFDEVTTMSAKEAKLLLKDSNEKMCYIDSEKYYAKPLHFTLLPKHLVVYRKSQSVL